MSSNNTVTTDVLVIGGGMAGLFAAIKAREQGCITVLVDKGYVGRSGATSFAGGYFLLFNSDWGHDIDTALEGVSRIGEYVNDRDWSRIVIRESFQRYSDLVNWGVPFVEEQGQLHINPGLVQSVNMWRWRYHPVIRSQAVAVGVRILDRIMITDLIRQEGRVLGAVGFHTRTGIEYVFQAKATVISAGQRGW